MSSKRTIALAIAAVLGAAALVPSAAEAIQVSGGNRGSHYGHGGYGNYSYGRYGIYGGGMAFRPNSSYSYRHRWRGYR